jgi:hypothetical protein
MLHGMRGISASSFDPRAWNLLTGAVLVTACGPGSVTGVTEATATSSSEDSTESSEDSTESSGNTTDSTQASTSDTGDTADTETGEDAECITDDDCFDSVPNVHCVDGICVECEYAWDCNDQPGSECINHVCEFVSDGCYGFGYYHYETACGQYELCHYDGYGGTCLPVDDLPLPDCNTDVMGIPTVLDPGAPPLALSFVDVDDDGRDELAVATATQLLVYELGVPDPVVTDRAIASDVVQAMASAQFDGQVGEDLMLLVDTDVHGYSSDGISAFVNPSTLPSPVDMPRGLLAGDFDGQAPEDLWVWGASGARLYLGGIDLSVDVPVGDGYTNGAAAFEYPSPHAGLLLGNAYVWVDLSLFDLAGGPLANTVGHLDSVAAVSAPDEGRFVSAGYRDANWSHIRFRDADTLAETQVHVRAGHPSVLAGDFDGDQWQEVLAVGDAVELILGVLDGPCISTLELGIQPAAILPAIGDHDGDGDDELAVSSAAGEVIIVDVE